MPQEPTHQSAQAPIQTAAEPPQSTLSSQQREAEQSYLARLRAKIQSCLRYPMMARRLGLEGSTQLRFSVHADGSVGAIEVLHSAGHHTLDERAVATLQEAAPFEPPPQGKVLNITVPVLFSLQKGE
ncbi:MAG: energy transducer TonB [Campylobacterales bacterium]|nr:energy transducer TonB [Campylobacterales bacterium]